MLSCGLLFVWYLCATVSVTYYTLLSRWQNRVYSNICAVHKGHVLLARYFFFLFFFKYEMLSQSCPVLPRKSSGRKLLSRLSKLFSDKGGTHWLSGVPTGFLGLSQGLHSPQHCVEYTSQALTLAHLLLSGAVQAGTRTRSAACEDTACTACGDSRPELDIFTWG